MNFFSKFFNKSSSKEEPKNPESKFLPKKKAAIEERFILKFIENGGKFLYCENLGEVQKNFDITREQVEKEAIECRDDLIDLYYIIEEKYRKKHYVSKRGRPRKI